MKKTVEKNKGDLMKIGIMEHDGNVARAAGFTVAVSAGDKRIEKQICEEIVYRCNLHICRSSETITQTYDSPPYHIEIKKVIR